MKNPTIDIVVKFNFLKISLLEWKHSEECLCKEQFPQATRDEMKHDYENILKEFPEINNILPSFYCTICNTKK
jgi:hypothetical protein